MISWQCHVVCHCENTSYKDFVEHTSPPLFQMSAYVKGSRLQWNILTDEEGHAMWSEVMLINLELLTDY